MTRDSGKDKVGSASKSGSGVSPGDPNYQNVTDNTPPSNAASETNGPLSLPASDPATTNRKTFNVMAPLTFPSSSNAASEGNGSPAPAQAQDASAIETSVTPASTDVLSALASNVGQAAPRPAAVSNNFTSLASRAGAKRTLIGGA